MIDGIVLNIPLYSIIANTIILIGSWNYKAGTAWRN